MPVWAVPFGDVGTQGLVKYITFSRHLRRSEGRLQRKSFDIMSRKADGDQPADK